MITQTDICIVTLTWQQGHVRRVVHERKEVKRRHQFFNINLSIITSLLFQFFLPALNKYFVPFIP